MSRSKFRPLATAVVVLAVAALASPSALLAGPPVKYERIVVVSPEPGDPVASGEELLDALSEIGPASAADRWLIQIEPGIYDVGTEPVDMVPFVDIAGSGTGVTVIRGLGQSNEVPFQFDLGVVNGADDAELRDLTVECRTEGVYQSCLTIANFQAAPRYLRVRVVSTTPGDFHWGFRNTLASPKIEDVEIVVGNGTKDYGIANGGFTTRSEVTGTSIEVTSPAGEAYGLFNTDGGTTGRFEDSRVTVEGSGAAVGVFTATTGFSFDTVVLRDVTVVARGAANSYGLQGGDHTTVVEHSKIVAEGAGGRALYTDELPGGFRVKSSELSGAEIIAQGFDILIGSSQVAGGGAIDGLFTEACSGVYDESFTHFAAVCP